MSALPYDQPLDTSLRQIRLLMILPKPHPIDGRLQCHFTIGSLPKGCDELSYQALSYMWGEADDFDFQIWLNDVLVPVRQNLLCALRVLRADEDTIKLPIWIDALCIDQENIEERGHQVDMMGVIYSSAERVIAWLRTPDIHELDDLGLDTRRSHPERIPAAAFDFIQRSVFDLLWDSDSMIKHISAWTKDSSIDNSQERKSIQGVEKLL